jgi:hypothetical protein
MEYGLWCLTTHSTITSVISWRSVLFVKETGVHGENHRPVASYRQTLSHNVVLSTSKNFFCIVRLQFVVR